MSMLSLRIRRTIAAVILGAGASLMPVGPSQAQPMSYLIKGSSDTVYYHSSAGKRYFFPNESIFKSWYADFTSVAQISDAELAQIPLAGNVTYRPGSTLVKIQTDPKVYAVDRYGVLHWVKTEVVASAIYGLDWNKKVADISDAFFSNYIIGWDIDAPNQYSRNEALASASTPEENIRPATFVPEPKAPVAPGVIVNNPAVEVNLSSSQAVQNQTVNVDVDVTGSIYPITKIVVRAEGVSEPYATCMNTTQCFAQFVVQTAPLNLHFYAEATDSMGTTFTTPVDARPRLLVASASNQVTVSVSPLSASVGTRVNFTSDADGLTDVSGHKIYALIPGVPNPVLWKDCGATNICAASTPFYRTTYLYAQVTTNGAMYNSAPATITISGDAPKPSIAVTSRTGNVAHLAITAPFGETIGKTVLVEGTNIDEDPAVAMCDASCELSLQIMTSASYTAFSWVGGKAERSNTLTIAP